MYRMQAGNSITPMDALKLFGCFRLGARIWDLEQAGHKIKHESVTENGKTFAKYSIDISPAFTVHTAPDGQREMVWRGEF